MKWLVSKTVIYFKSTLHETSKIRQIKPYFFLPFTPIVQYFAYLTGNTYCTKREFMFIKVFTYPDYYKCVPDNALMLPYFTSQFLFLDRIHNFAESRELFDTMKKILVNKIKPKIEELHDNTSLGKTLPGFQKLLSNAYSLGVKDVIKVEARNTELYQCEILFFLSYYH